MTRFGTSELGVVMEAAALIVMGWLMLRTTLSLFGDWGADGK